MFKSILTKIAAAVAITAGAIGSANAFVVLGGDFKMTIDVFDSATTNYTVACNTVLTCDASAGSRASGSIGSINPSADTMGIFSIATIVQQSTGTQWFTRPGAGVPGSGHFLTGIFGNLQDMQVAFNNESLFGGTRTEVASVGGTFQIFKTAVNYNPSLGPLVEPGSKDLNANLYPGISGSELVLDGVFTPGVIPGDSTTTFISSFTSSTLAGSSSGYLNIIGGTYQARFDTNTVAIPGNPTFSNADIFATFTFAPTAIARNNGWTVASTADIIGNTNTVPEPGSLALIALGLLGVGTLTRRKS